MLTNSSSVILASLSLPKYSIFTNVSIRKFYTYIHCIHQLNMLNCGFMKIIQYHIPQWKALNVAGLTVLAESNSTCTI